MLRPEQLQGEHIHDMPPLGLFAPPVFLLYILLTGRLDGPQRG
jgi:hypothetical protein